MTSAHIKKYNNAKDLLTDEQRDVLRNKGNKIEKLQTDIDTLSKPLLQSESTWSTHVTPTTLSIFDDEKSWSGIEGIRAKKLTNKNIKQFHEVNGQSWKNMKDVMRMESEDESYYSEDSPTTTRLDAKDMDVFGAMPLKEDIVVIKCNQCSKPLLASQFNEHLESCRPSDAHTDEDTDLSNNKKRALEADTLAENPNKKKPKKEKPKKLSKQKAPLDLDKQCGVIQAPSTTPCTRSITCKNHPMGSKRAVEGRSQPYDVLLAAYQKKSIGRPNGKDQAAKIKENGESNLLVENAIKNNNFLNSEVPSVPEEAFVDSDEEVESVLQSIKQSRPFPLAQKPYYYTKRRRQCFRLKDILLDAITPRSAVNNNTKNRNTPQPIMYSQQQQQQQLLQQQQQQQQYPIETSFISLNNTPHFW